MHKMIFGCGELSRVMYATLRVNPMWNVLPYDNFLGLTCDPEFIKETPKWLHKEFSIKPFLKSVINPHDLMIGIYLPIGYKKMNQFKEDKFNQAKAFGLVPLEFIDDRAVIDWDVVKGQANIILAAATVQTGTVLGKGNTIWQNAHVGHSCQIGDFNWITTNSTLCSSVVVKDRCFIGANAVICPNVTLKSRTFVAAGAIITEDTDEDSVYLEGRNNKISKKSYELNLK